jgi:hypothetical protein
VKLSQVSSGSVEKAEHTVFSTGLLEKLTVMQLVGWSVKLLLALASTVILGFEAHLHP